MSQVGRAATANNVSCSSNSTVITNNSNSSTAICSFVICCVAQNQLVVVVVVVFCLRCCCCCCCGCCWLRLWSRRRCDYCCAVDCYYCCFVCWLCLQLLRESLCFQPQFSKFEVFLVEVLPKILSQGHRKRIRPKPTQRRYGIYVVRTWSSTGLSRSGSILHGCLCIAAAGMNLCR